VIRLQLPCYRQPRVRPSPQLLGRRRAAVAPLHPRPFHSVLTRAAQTWQALSRCRPAIHPKQAERQLPGFGRNWKRRKLALFRTALLPACHPPRRGHDQPQLPGTWAACGWSASARPGASSASPSMRALRRRLRSGDRCAWRWHLSHRLKLPHRRSPAPLQQQQHRHQHQPQRRQHKLH
jgi:hypothetical protein